MVQVIVVVAVVGDGVADGRARAVHIPNDIVVVGLPPAQIDLRRRRKAHGFFRCLGNVRPQLLHGGGQRLRRGQYGLLRRAGTGHGCRQRRLVRLGRRCSRARKRQHAPRGHPHHGGSQHQRDPSLLHRLVPRTQNMALLYAACRRIVKLPRKISPPCRDIRPPGGALLSHGRKKTAALCAAVFLCAFIRWRVRLICRTSPPASAGARSGPWPRPRCAGTERPHARGTRGSGGSNEPRSSGTPDSRRRAPWSPA